MLFFINRMGTDLQEFGLHLQGIESVRRGCQPPESMSGVSIPALFGS